MKTHILSKRFGLAVLSLLIAWPLTTQAGSYYSRSGVGLLQYRDGVKATGMGGLGLAIADSVSIFILNPATMASVKLTHIQGEFLYDRADVSLPNTSARFHDANVNGLSILFPIKRGYAFALGIQPYSRSDFSFNNTGRTSSSDSVSYEEISTGSGGLDNFYLALAGTVGPVRLGLAADFYFGTVRRIWRINYSSSALGYTEDEVSTSMQGFGIHGGIHTALGAWELGAAAGTPVGINAEVDLDTRYGAEFDPFERSVRLPHWAGVAAAYHPNRRWVLGAQLRSQFWSSVETGKLLGAEGVDSHIAGFGLQFTPSIDPFEGFLRGLSYRLGWSYAILPYEDGFGSKVTEYLASAGIGIPFNRGFSRIDFAVEFGKRGDADNPAEENLFRFSASVNGSERWFVRRRK